MSNMAQMNEVLKDLKKLYLAESKYGLIKSTDCDKSPRVACKSSVSRCSRGQIESGLSNFRRRGNRSNPTCHSNRSSRLCTAISIMF